MEIDTVFGTIKEKWDAIKASPTYSEAEVNTLMALTLITTAADLMSWEVFARADGSTADSTVKAVGIVHPDFDLEAK